MISTRFLSFVRLIAISLAAAFTAPIASGAEMFPFVLPWDDASSGVTDLSSWNEAPAGKHGFVTVRDGHLFAGDKRWRVFGVNVCFGANFPDKEAAPKVAARLAKLGVNCVRFHHMDMFSAPAGIFAKDGRTLDPERLDRLDFFIAQLKERGIYTNLNLHVSRTHPDRPKAEKNGNPSYDKGVDNFSAAMIALQKEFARALLTHVNPYTRTSYAKEPAVAFVEINNENALFFEWHTGGLDEIAAPYRAELGALWTEFLKGRRGTEEKIQEFMATGSRPAGAEILQNGDFSRGGDRWASEGHEGTLCKATYENGEVKLAVSGPARENWHAQFNQAALVLTDDEAYAVRFRAKADRAARITVNIGQAHAPWKSFGSKSVEIGTEWREYRVNVKVEHGDTNARVSFSGLARPDGVTYWLDDVSLRPAEIAGELERESDGSFVAWTRDEYARRSPLAQEEWLSFLAQVESRYWPGMQQFLREDLGVGSLIIGTQLGWSPFFIQQGMDVIDSHSYWQHPHFPKGQWDPVNWRVNNVPMAGATDGGTLPPLALQRVEGKPYLVTEYNHSAPNLYGAETFPLLCAYAALQDWDGVFVFAYSHRTDDWDKQHFPSFFDIDQHPVKLATLPGAVALFRRGDVQAAREAAIATIHPINGLLQVGKSGPRLGAEQFGVKRMESMIRRVGVRLGDGEKFTARPEPAAPFASDTGELAWDTKQRVVTVNARRSKAVVGEGKGRVFTLGDVKVRVNNPWACIQATVIEGDDFAGARRILLTTTAAAENTAMQWQDAEKTTVSNKWGRAPSLVEPVTAEITLPNPARFKVWALDERGQRRDRVELTDGVLNLKPEHRTLWYEVAVE